MHYNFNIPENMMVWVELGHVIEMAESLCLWENEAKQELINDASMLRANIKKGIETFGIVKHDQFGEMYAYEVDGCGKHLLMDDANVPSLLSIPYIGYVPKSEEIAENTRRFILSGSNPWWFKGSKASGIGSPHTGKNRVWHMAMLMEGLTDHQLAKAIVKQIVSHGGIHESIDPNAPHRYTRKWFGWANALFAELVINAWSKMSSSSPTTSQQHDSTIKRTKCSMLQIKERWDLGDAVQCFLGSASAMSCRLQGLDLNAKYIMVTSGNETWTDGSLGYRTEDFEYPRYEPGALTLSTAVLIPQKVLKHASVHHSSQPYHALSTFLGALETKMAGISKPLTTHTIPTLLVTRYEYVNLFHTVTDWFNVYWTLQTYAITGPYQIVWMDGHASGSLDSVWKRLWTSSIDYVRSLPPELRLDDAITVPVGYNSPLWHERPNSEACTEFVDGFVESILRALSISTTARPNRNQALLIDRRPYAAHPRNLDKHIDRVMTNIEEVERVLTSMGWAVQRVQLETMAFEEQVKAVRAATLMVGIHGAGLSHLLWMSDGATVVEFTPTPHLDMFERFARWRPNLTHRRITIPRTTDGRYTLPPTAVRQIGAPKPKPPVLASVTDGLLPPHLLSKDVLLQTSASSR